MWRKTKALIKEEQEQSKKQGDIINESFITLKRNGASVSNSLNRCLYGKNNSKTPYNTSSIGSIMTLTQESDQGQCFY